MTEKELTLVAMLTKPDPAGSVNVLINAARLTLDRVPSHRMASVAKVVRDLAARVDARMAAMDDDEFAD